MNHRTISILLFIHVLIFSAVSTAVTAQQSCRDLKSLAYRNVTITQAAAITTPPDYFPPRTTGPFGTRPGLKVSVSFCRVAGYVEPVKNSHIGFEVWMPLKENWNNRFLAAGNPAFEGAISYGGLAGAVQRGYATASTDTGHVASGHSWALGNPERIVDWGHRAVHEMTVNARRLIEAFYGEPPRYSYWNSCHNGGNQGLNEVQRYPEDYDGVIAGDPAYYVTRLQSGSEYIAWLALKDGINAPGYIPPVKYPVIHRAVLDACDAKDGVRDSVIEDPTRCGFDPVSIQCPGADTDSCLTAAQVDTARRVYTGAKFADGSRIYSGFEPGSELRWGEMMKGPAPLEINNGFFKYMVFEDPDWDFRTFDLELHTRLAAAKVGKAVDAYNPDLKPFKDNGGKLIMYQSWGETWVPPRSAIDYYNNVVDEMDGLKKTQDFFRLFMVPGMGMCPGFSNPADFDVLEALQQWRENQVPPGKITASYRNMGTVYRTRPVCPWPQAAIYKGTGDINDAANFSCGIPDW